MTQLLVITHGNETKAELRKGLAPFDVTCSFTSYNNGVSEAVAARRPDILLYEVGEPSLGPEVGELIRRVKKTKKIPVMALIPAEMLESFDLRLDFDDFLAGPYDSRELMVRINRLLQKTKEDKGHQKITGNGLTINLTTCEVSVEGSIVELTFKEYELLKLLASSPGRVYTRESLLDKVWGYDYFGGDRTVDVHVRRLRSKIEDASHSFIETVRNIGYRFRKDA